ncbi:MAG: DUF493 domain-containing protein [Deltaproteobacteria bacterium]|nr:DUF493 domain-containing protein [Deltaproteobacteria bacterium]
MTDEKQELIKKLEALHSFPCDYPFKLITLNAPEVLPAALREISMVLPDLEVEPTVTRRESERGKHQSITITIMIPSAHIVVQLYERFRTLDGLHMLL